MEGGGFLFGAGWRVGERSVIIDAPARGALCEVRRILCTVVVDSRFAQMTSTKLQPAGVDGVLALTRVHFLPPICYSTRLFLVGGAVVLEQWGKFFQQQNKWGFWHIILFKGSSFFQGCGHGLGASNPLQRILKKCWGTGHGDLLSLGPSMM